MNKKIFLYIVLLIVMTSFVSAITVENNDFRITCLPDEATVQSNGFTQDCFYTNKDNNYVEIEVLYCLDTKLYEGEIKFDENIIEEVPGGILGLGTERIIVDKIKKEKKFNSDVTITEEDVIIEYDEILLDDKGKPVKDNDGKIIRIKKNKTEKVKYYEVIDADNYINVKDIPVDNKLNIDGLKSECYSSGNLTLEEDETRKIIYNYKPVLLDKVKWDTYIKLDGEIVYGLDPQFNAEIYEIGGNRSEHYYWINGSVLNVDILSYSPLLAITQNNISNLQNRTGYTFLESKNIGLTNFIRNVRVNMTWLGNVSINISADNGSTWLNLYNENLTDKSKVYNFSSPVGDNNILKYQLSLNRWMDSNLIINGTGQEIFYVYYQNTTTPPNITDWRENNVSLANLNLGFDINETGSFTDYSTYNNTVVIGT